MALNLELMKKVVATHTDGRGVPDWNGIKNDYEASDAVRQVRSKDYYRIWWTRNGVALPENTARFVRRLQRKMEVTPEEVAAVKRLREQGYNIEMWTEDGRVYAQNRASLPYGVRYAAEALAEGETIRIGLVSDTHIGSKYTAWDAVEKFYKYAKKRGVTTILHAGDLTDGHYKNRDASFFEQSAHGFQEQLAMVTTAYPHEDGIVTYFITGNHDVTHLYNGGADIGRTVAALRPDMVYLGHNYASFAVNDRIDIELYHPTDGSSRIISQRVQDIIDSPSKKAPIIAVGHYHKMGYVYYKGVFGITMPSFQKQTGYMRDKGLESVVGGIILTIRTRKDGSVLSVEPEFFDMSEGRE